MSVYSTYFFLDGAPCKPPHVSAIFGAAAVTTPQARPFDKDVLGWNMSPDKMQKSTTERYLNCHFLGFYPTDLDEISNAFLHRNVKPHFLFMRQN